MEQSNSEYTIEHILDVIFVLYTTELQRNTSRVLANVLTSFGLTLPSSYKVNRTNKEMIVDCYRDMYEVIKILGWKHETGEIIITKNGSLQWGKNNIINQENLNLEVGTMIAGNVSINQSIGNKTVIDTGCFLKDVALIDSKLQQGVIIEGGMYSKIVQSKIDLGTVLFGGAKIRESHIGPRNELGQLESVRSSTGECVKALHWSYLGDTFVGNQVNISNFFGITNSSPIGKKAKTIIGDNVFLGGHACIVSGAQGITIGDDAIIGAGATVLCDVPVGHTYITKDKIYPNKK